MKAPRTQRVFAYAVLVTGYGALLALTPTGGLPHWTGFAFFCGLAIAAEWAYSPLRTGSLSAAFAALLPPFILWGLVPAVWVNLIGNLIGNGWLRRRSLPVALFNGAQSVLSTLAGGLAYYVFSGGADLQAPPHMTFPAAVGLFGLVAGYYLVNHTLVEVYLSLGQGMSVWRSLTLHGTEAMKWDLLNYVVTVPSGLVLAWLYSEQGARGAAMLALPLAALAYVFRLYMSLSLASRELTILYEVAQKVSSVLKLERLFDLIADATRRVVNYDRCCLFLWDEIKQQLTPAVVRSRDPSLFDNFSLRLGEGIVGYVAETRQAEIINDATRDPRLQLPSDQRLGTRSLMVVPLVAEDQLIGVICVGRETTAAFTPEHLRLLTILASQASVAVENAILYQRTEHLAITDPMTGLFNYRYFYVRLGDELRRARLQDNSVSLVYIDMDNFKQYNDTFGHQVGDAILREFADIIRANIRESDTPVRYAGDEFVVLLPHTETEEAQQVAERIRRSVAGHVFLGGSTAAEIKMTISIGVAGYPDTAQTEAELIYQADQAMYRSKREGLNRVYAWSESMEAG